MIRTKEKLIVAGNWKMNKTLPEAEAFYARFMQIYRGYPQVAVKIAPPFTHLYRMYQLFRDTDVDLMAQNMHWADHGAYTGEISAPMLESIGVHEVILGHSERRQLFGETDEVLRRKVDKAVEENMRIVFCVGETLAEREQGRHFDTVRRQVAEALGHLTPEDWALVTIAYEPVWAIGTGHTATPAQADEMHAFIREWVGTKYGEQLAGRLPILYGGSVKPANAASIFSMPHVDGALIGGASLDPDSFNVIIELARQQFE